MNCCERYENFEPTENLYDVGAGFIYLIYICRECKRYYRKPLWSNKYACEVEYNRQDGRWDDVRTIVHEWGSEVE